MKGKIIVSMSAVKKNINNSETIYRNAKERIRICMITYVGAPSFIPTVHHAGIYLSNNGYECTAICVPYNNITSKFEKINEGFTITRMALRSRDIFHKVFGIGTKYRFIAALQYVLTYTEYVMKTIFLSLKFNADLYEAHDLPALLPTVIIAKVKKKPLIYYAHELYPEMHDKMRFSRIWRLMERKLIRFAKIIITPEENRARIYLDEYHANCLPTVIRNCPPYVTPRSSKKLHEYLNSINKYPKKIVLYQGLMDHSRCVRELVQAAPLFNKGIVLVMMGASFTDWKAGLKIPDNVVLLPRVSYEELNDYTASADIGVLFYRKDCRNNYYCAPNKIHEYMMMGLPVIAPNYPGIQKIVDGEKVGISVDPGNIHQIADAVNRLSEDENLYNTSRENGLRLSLEKYNWEIEIVKLMAIYKQVTGSQKAENGVQLESNKQT
jgi:glycosyltransferase involved in cell wall biosynthesis